MPDVTPDNNVSASEAELEALMDTDVEVDKPAEVKVEVDVAALQAELASWKAHSRKHEEDSKKFKPLAEKWTEHEKTGKSAEEVLTEELNTLKAEIAKSQKQLVINKVISEKKLPESALAFLTGDTEDELNAQADNLITLIGNTVTKPAPKAPLPNPLQGKGQDKATNEEDALASFFDSL